MILNISLHHYKFPDGIRKYNGYIVDIIADPNLIKKDEENVFAKANAQYMELSHGNRKH